MTILEGVSRGSYCWVMWGRNDASGWHRKDTYSEQVILCASQASLPMKPGIQMYGVPSASFPLLPIFIMMEIRQLRVLTSEFLGNLYLLRIGQALVQISYQCLRCDQNKIASTGFNLEEKKNLLQASCCVVRVLNVIRARLGIHIVSAVVYNGCYMQSSIRMADDAQEVAQR
ncbi:hypothetical protein Prudu_020522 [Prunus dulcis]|uniref:Uncharacterized protein n=1 Tax=Prunus dulcis TaxID=3755 RepID=A0A4Y1RVG6_PRUDU|nr:hypothetical protein Prudu_020522 [Prunus dulcis]